MGKDQSKIVADNLDSGAITIDLDQPYYIIGEHIKGKVVLFLPKDYPMRKVEIRFQGMETVKIHGTPHEARICDFTLPLDEAEEDANLKALLPKTLKAGRHEYPFCFRLKENQALVATGAYTSSGLDCHVTYIARAFVIPFCQNFLRLKASKNIEVLERLNSQKNVVQKQVYNLKKCCRPPNSVSVKAILQSSSFLLHSGIDLCLYINTLSSDIGIKRVEVQLLEKVRAIVNQKTLIKEKNKIAQWTFQGLGARKDQYLQRKRLLIEDQRIEDLETMRGCYFRKNYLLKVIPIFDMLMSSSKIPLEFPLSLSKRPRGKNKSLDRPNIRRLAEHSAVVEGSREYQPPILLHHSFAQYPYIQ